MSKNYNPMRKNWIWGLSLLLIGGMASCKSSQSAYKAAYEKAQEKKIEEPVTTGTTRSNSSFDDNDDGSYSGTE